MKKHDIKPYDFFKNNEDREEIIRTARFSEKKYGK
jgi:hypothetical protein